MAFQSMVPVLPTEDVKRDIQWYEEHTGFKLLFGDEMYAGLGREGLEFHLQWHSGTQEDPITGFSVMKIFVDNIEELFEELLKRGTVTEDQLKMDTPWGTHEFGFYDLNKNAIFFVQDKEQ